MIRFFRFFRFFKSDCDQVEHLRMGRTIESTVFEVAALAIIIATWVLAIWMYRHAPESIPTHFDLEGNPNNEGSRLVILIMAGVSTVLTALLMACAYVPTYVVNPPSKLENFRQYVLASRMVRIIALVMALLFACVIFMMCYPESPVPKYLLITLTVMIVVVAIVFAIMIKMARTR